MNDRFEYLAKVTEVHETATEAVAQLEGGEGPDFAARICTPRREPWMEVGGTVVLYVTMVPKVAS